MRAREVPDALLSVPISGEAEARARAWALVERAHAERGPMASTRRRVRPLLVLAAVAALAAGALSPPGLALLDSLRERVGVRRAAPGLFSLPAPGRLLVVSEGGGVWIVQRDGSRRRLGAYDDAEWSPHGLFVVATRRNELLALEPGGRVRWALGRRSVSWPRWAPSGFRIAYAARSGLRVVAGDGTGDRLLETDAPVAPPVWQPGTKHVLAYLTARGLFVTAVDERRVLWRFPLHRGGARRLAWSADGQLLAVVGTGEARFFSATGKPLRTIPLTQKPISASFAPRGHVLALHLAARSPGRASRSEVRLVDADRPTSARHLFAGSGSFDGLAWSPDGRWLLVDWRTADQWVFLRTAGVPRIKAVGTIAGRFGGRPGGALEVLDRWCCVP